MTDVQALPLCSATTGNFYPIRVVGTSFYQRELTRLHKWSGFYVDVCLAPQTENEHDPFAVSIHALCGTKQAQVGWLSREINREYHEVLLPAFLDTPPVVGYCRGQMTKDTVGSFALWLNLTADAQDVFMGMRD